ncbi:MAG: hypothetical protein HOQ05_12760 [Corynebacteriales bacterium]|nr:hypothetical protein [Mycobacteriales bacterium]
MPALLDEIETPARRQLRVIRRRGELTLCLPPALDPPATAVPQPRQETPAYRQLAIEELDHYWHYRTSRVDSWSPEAFHARPTGRAELTAPASHARHIAQAIVECIAGLRGVQQLMPWLSTDVYEAIAAKTKMSIGRRRRAHAFKAPNVRSVHICEPDDGVAEVTAVIGQGDDVYAAAMRLEGLDGRWRCTLFEIV